MFLLQAAEAAGAAGATPWGAIAGLAGGLLTGINGLITAGKQRKVAKQLQAQSDAKFGAAEQIAKQQQAQAQNQYNARMAGATQAEANINANQANTLSAMGRNATDSSQLLALAGGVQGNTDNALNNLASAEGQDKERRYGYVNAANQGIQNLNENRAAQLGQAAAGVGQASQLNQYNGFNGLANGLIVGGDAYGKYMAGRNGNSLAGSTVPQASYTPNLYSSAGMINPANISLTPPNIINTSYFNPLSPNNANTSYNVKPYTPGRIN